MKGRYASTDASKGVDKNNPFREDYSNSKYNEVEEPKKGGAEDAKKGRVRNKPFAAMRRRIGRNISGSDDGMEDDDEVGLDALTETAKSAEVHPNRVEASTTSRLKPMPENTAFQTTITLTQAGADIGMAAAEAEAESNGWRVTICICDAAGVPIQVKRNTSIGAASYDLAVNKAKSAALFGKTTGTKVHSEVDALTTDYPYQQIKGGVPLNLNGICCGAVGVSGILDTEQQEQVAKAGVKAMADMYWSFQVMAEESASSPPL